MTAVVAWIRKFRQGPEELCIASDSRLRGDGRTVDMAPKIFSFSRGDMVIGFAGDTGIAYPFLQQLVFTTESFRAAKTRGLDIIEYKSHILKILNEMTKSVSIEVEEVTCSDCEFILAGYSWIKKEFKIWKIFFCQKSKEYTMRKCRITCGQSKIIEAGSDSRELQRELSKILTDRRGKNWNTGEPLDFEPLEALASILKRAKKEASIGGPPQLVKVYQYMQTISVPIVWQSEDESYNITLLGRTILEYENIDNWALNPFTLEKTKTLES